jgi:hypothetical protein
MDFGWFFLVGGLLLEILVLYYLSRGPIRRFPFLFAYCLLLLLSSLFSGILSTQGGFHSREFVIAYWSSDLVLHGFVLLVVISLIGQSLGKIPNKKWIVGGIALAVLCFAVISLIVLHQEKWGLWMTPVTRNLSFCEELLNLVLWTILIQNREQDPQLLLVSAGLGIQVTGEVIGHTLRMYSHSESTVWLPNVLVNVAELLALLIWVWAFREARNKGNGPSRHNASGVIPHA